ncbi:heat shock protein DnaJ domain protein [Methylocella silvestris BL2]|uniref:Heat shock protein DnaJ domain protein n=1 Tax=Methylocella silvestris (strain DSM 15510 / CIP 108128 / LMG 27833 / NCIMB 13906 / BL2) TaxID=395965 RepID=B8EPQ8_METSB|nr:J domain-containing protein [Methylocella silvestris]ACK50912.1 heat shock protein DnaJ domain protein [Methylocella silvestris BL2]
MAGIRIGSETGNEAGGWWVVFVGAFVSLGAAGEVLTWLDVRVPVPENMMVRVLAFLLFVAIAYGVFTAVVLIAARLITLAFSAVERTAHFAVAQTEWLLTMAISHGIPFLVSALKLPLAPFRFAASWAHAQYLAPALERRRQRAELRRLYDEVRDEYVSFDDFLRQFEGGTDSETDATENTDAADDKAGTPEPTPVDKFAAACRTIGLSEDGAFTQAELKTRFHELMKALHPDLHGPNVFASQINEARETIKSRKGWK